MATKIAIVLSEGGLRCAYSAGAILALVEKYKITEPHLVMGSSGGAGTLAYYVSGQYEAIRYSWENLLSTDKFISLSRLKKVMDIDYLVEKVFKGENGLDVPKFNSSAINFYFATTNKKTGECKYFNKEDDADIFEVLRASSAMPLVYNKSVVIDGVEYVDGSLSANIHQHIIATKLKGATKIIAIDSSDNSWLSDLFLKLSGFFINTKLLPNIKQGLELKRNIQDDKSVFLVKIKMTGGTLNNNQQHLKETLQRGYDDVVNNKNLEEFLNV